MLLNSEKSKIGLVSFFKPALNFEVTQIQETAARIQILLLTIGLLFLTLGMNSDFRTIKWRSVRLIVLIIYFAALRFVLYWSGFPTRFLEGPLVDPSHFSSTFAWGIVKTPIEFFVTNVLLLIIGLKFFLYIFEYFKEKKSTRFTLLKILIAPLIAILTFYTMRGLAASIKSVVFDSTIRYFKEPDLIPSLPALVMNLNILLFGLASIFVIISFVLLIGKFPGRTDPSPASRRARSAGWCGCRCASGRSARAAATFSVAFMPAAGSSSARSLRLGGQRARDFQPALVAVRGVRAL